MINECANISLLSAILLIGAEQQRKEEQNLRRKGEKSNLTLDLTAR